MQPFKSKTTIVLAALLTLFSITSSPALRGQDSFRKGQHVEPAYEGWWNNADGTISFVFGYMNENWEQELDVPVGDNNSFSPGEADRGQPTHFLPRRNRFTFEVVVPGDWGDRELVWTLASNGVTKRAYATLATDYLIDKMVIASETGSLGAGTSSPESRANIAPIASVQGDSIRTVKVGEPLRIVTHVSDDGLPKPRNRTIERNEEDTTERMLRRPRRTTVGKVNGLYLSWNVYRGNGAASFDPPQSKVWEDTRTSANSPWGWMWTPPPVPEDGLYEVNVTFDQPGTYTLWGRADDGGLYHDQYISVVVEP
jgi:hypothetical protein